MCIRDSPWNDDLTEKDMPVLYNIEHDPSEKYNVTNQHSDIVDRIVTLSEEHILKVTKIPSKYDAILPDYQSAYDAYNKK